MYLLAYPDEGVVELPVVLVIVLFVAGLLVACFLFANGIETLSFGSNARRGERRTRVGERVMAGA